jgi:hypothetical protein
VCRVVPAAGGVSPQPRRTRLHTGSTGGTAAIWTQNDKHEYDNNVLSDSGLTILGPMNGRDQDNAGVLLTSQYLSLHVCACVCIAWSV